MTASTPNNTANRLRFMPRPVYDEHTCFKCVICAKKFMRKEKLRQHLRKHINSKPYTCQTCNKKFIKKNHLDMHVKSLCHSLKKISVHNINYNNSNSNSDSGSNENFICLSTSTPKSPLIIGEELMISKLDCTLKTTTNNIDNLKIISDTSTTATNNTDDAAKANWFNPMAFIKNNYRRH